METKSRKIMIVLIGIICLLVVLGFVLPGKLNFRPREKIAFTSDDFQALWPFMPFVGVVLAVTVYYLFDPRRGEWEKFMLQMKKHQRMYINGLALEIEEEYRDD